MPKPELEFFPVDDLPWTAVPGAPPGHYQKILTDDPDKMFVTRMLKVDPGCASTETFVHDFWEEVYILEGSQWDGDKFFEKGMYACRPPGMKHGPYRTEGGVVTLEVRYARDGMPQHSKNILDN
ncbi:MAG: cupin domain-containing protein [Rhodomicrobium sp.]